MLLVGVQIDKPPQPRLIERVPGRLVEGSPQRNITVKRGEPRRVHQMESCLVDWAGRRGQHDFSETTRRLRIGRNVGTGRICNGQTNPPRRWPVRAHGWYEGTKGTCGYLWVPLDGAAIATVAVDVSPPVSVRVTDGTRGCAWPELRGRGDSFILSVLRSPPHVGAMLRTDNAIRVSAMRRHATALQAQPKTGQFDDSARPGRRSSLLLTGLPEIDLLGCRLWARLIMLPTGDFTCLVFVKARSARSRLRFRALCPSQ